MTALGAARRRYSREVEPRPFSRFTSAPAEVAANESWAARAAVWAATVTR